MENINGKKIWGGISTSFVILLFCFILLSCQTTTTTSGNGEATALKKELDEVKQKLEEVQHRVSVVQSMMDGHERTITDLEIMIKKTSGTVGEGDALNQKENHGALAANTEEVVKEENLSPKSVSHTRDESSPSNEISIIHETPDDIYKQGFAALKGKEYKKALSKFQTVLSNYPEHPLADNAAYWTGEVYYVQNDFSKAIRIFENLVDQYPGEEKVGDALLKIGYSYYAMKDNDNATKYLNRIMVYYPDSDLRKKAESVLNKIKSMKKQGTEPND